MAETDYTILGENIARLLEGQREMSARLDRMHDEQRSTRNEIGRLNQNQMDTARSIRDTIRAINSLRTDLELMIRTEIGGLFAHLETRLEARIAERLEDPA